MLGRKIALKNKKGETVAYTVVSDEDYDRVQQGKWHLSKGYAQGRCGDFHGRLHRFIMGAEKGGPMGGSY
jgi:hypothetical protein